MSLTTLTTKGLEEDIAALIEQQGPYAGYMCSPSCTTAQMNVYLTCYIEKEREIKKCRSEIRKINA